MNIDIQEVDKVIRILIQKKIITVRNVDGKDQVKLSDWFYELPKKEQDKIINKLFPK